MIRNKLAASLKVGVCCMAIAAGVGLPMAFAEEPATQPSTQPSANAESVHRAAKPNISAEAQTQLDAITAAYSSVKTLGLDGTLDVQTDVGGQTNKNSSTFTSTYEAPIKFRHAMKDDLVVGCTGDKSYVFVPDRKMYVQVDAPKTKADFIKTPSQASKAIEQQNPAMYLALSDNAGKALIEDATDVSTLNGEKIGDKAYPALAIKNKDSDIVVLLEPETHLIRQIRIDLSKALIAQGAPMVKKATATFDYTSVLPNNDQIKQDAFAWAPPEGAKDAAAAQKEMMQDAGATLTGKPAPAFSLEGLDGKKVATADLKGTVYILDFWATWCGPCKMALPHLDKLYQAKKGAGLKVFAVDEQEEKAAVQDFVTATKLGVPVLLDSDGKVGADYGANAIPETVLIGKDGLVKKVIVGYDESDAMEKAVEAELAVK